jgi:hypothetical protein
MSIRKAILFTLILPTILLCTALIAASVRGNFQAIDALLFLLAIFGPWAIGLLLGVIASAILKKPAKEPYFYLGGHLAIILTVVVFFCSRQIQ